MKIDSHTQAHLEIAATMKAVHRDNMTDTNGINIAIIETFIMPTGFMSS